MQINNTTQNNIIYNKNPLNSKTNISLYNLLDTSQQVGKYTKETYISKLPVKSQAEVIDPNYNPRDEYRTLTPTDELGKFMGAGGTGSLGVSGASGDVLRAYEDTNYDPNNPVVIVQGIEQPSGEMYEVKVAVNDVQPSNASQIEMFALIVYMDGEGMIDSATACDMLYTPFRYEETKIGNPFEKMDYIAPIQHNVNSLLALNDPSYFREKAALDQFKAWELEHTK